VSLLLDQALVDQFLEGISQLSVVAVSEGRMEALGLESTLIAQVHHRDGEDSRVLGLDPIEEVDIELEGGWAEVSERMEGDKGHGDLLAYSSVWTNSFNVRYDLPGYSSVWANNVTRFHDHPEVRFPLSVDRPVAAYAPGRVPVGRF